MAHRSTARTVSHVYTASGVYPARLTVRDARGAESHDTVSIAVDEAPPVASLDAPLDGSLFRHGTPVPLRGSAHDAVDGDLSGGALRWRIVLHHGHHIHLVASDLPGAQQSFTPAGDHDADSYYEIEFTATDSEGQQDTKTVVIRPETIALTLASSPPGATLSYSARGYLAGDRDLGDRLSHVDGVRAGDADRGGTALRVRQLVGRRRAIAPVRDPDRELHAHGRRAIAPLPGRPRPHLAPAGSSARRRPLQP